MRTWESSSRSLSGSLGVFNEMVEDAIDAIAGLITGTMFYFIFMWMSKGMKN